MGGSVSASLPLTCSQERAWVWDVMEARDCLPSYFTAFKESSSAQSYVVSPWPTSKSASQN